MENVYIILWQIYLGHRHCIPIFSAVFCRKYDENIFAYSFLRHDVYWTTALKSWKILCVYMYMYIWNTCIYSKYPNMPQRRCTRCIKSCYIIINPVQRYSGFIVVVVLYSFFRYRLPSVDSMFASAWHAVCRAHRALSTCHVLKGEIYRLYAVDWTLTALLCCQTSLYVVTVLAVFIACFNIVCTVLSIGVARGCSGRTCTPQSGEKN